VSKRVTNRFSSAATREAERATAGVPQRLFHLVRGLIASTLVAIPTALIRRSAWACVVGIAYLSLVPHSMEIRTPLPGGLEHVIAYAGAAALMKLGYPRRAFWFIATAFFAYSGLMEASQAFVDGRHSEFEGALWSGAGAFSGACTAEYLLRWTGANLLSSPLKTGQ
jgi:hypothetical protein